jgi:beta-lactamase superfamily II metal-dependent hydrolase
MGEMHHLNVGCADASIIISNGATFLIDTHGVEDYAKLLPTNKTIGGVFITHQHYDHFDGLRYLKDQRYTIEHLIYSPYDRRYNDTSVDEDEWNEFQSLKDHFANKGTKTYTPYRQDQWQKPFWETNGLKFWIIGPDKGIASRDRRELHDACLVILMDSSENNRKCLFAGDASDTNLEFIELNTTNYCNDILHASHHGSLNGAHLGFIKKASALYTVISTAAGAHDNVPHPTALQRYRDNTKEKVYRTDNDGTIKWTI